MSAIRRLYRRFSNRHVAVSGLSRERLAMTDTTVAHTASRTRHTPTMKACQTRVLYRSELSHVSDPIRTLAENEYCATRHHGRHTWYVGPSRARDPRTTTQLERNWLPNVSSASGRLCAFSYRLSGVVTPSVATPPKIAKSAATPTRWGTSDGAAHAHSRTRYRGAIARPPFAWRRGETTGWELPTCDNFPASTLPVDKSAAAIAARTERGDSRAPLACPVV